MSFRVLGYQPNVDNVIASLRKNTSSKRRCHFCLVSRFAISGDLICIPFRSKVGCAFPEGASEQVHFGEGVEAVCMATMAFTISINSWALLNVTTCSDDGRLGLLGGMLCCARATEGQAWIISVRAIIARRMGRPFDMRDSKIYTG